MTSEFEEHLDRVSLPFISVCVWQRSASLQPQQNPCRPTHSCPTAGGSRRAAPLTPVTQGGLNPGLRTPVFPSDKQAAWGSFTCPILVAFGPSSRLLCPPASHSDGFVLSLLAPVLTSSRRSDPSVMEVEPRKLKGKRDLIMPKSFQQVDFWCKWSLGLFLTTLTITPTPTPSLLRGFAEAPLTIGTHLLCTPGTGPGLSESSPLAAEVSIIRSHSPGEDTGRFAEG